jgi:hypothetical protein
MSLNSTAVTATVPVIVPAGSAAAPSLKFTGGTNTGLSSSIANVLSFETQGTERMTIGATGVVTVATNGSLTLPAGTTAAPTLNFAGGTTTGISAPTANELSFDTNGIERMSIDSTGTVEVYGTLVLAAGSVRSPSLKFTNGTNTGVSSPIANTMSFDVNGQERMNIDSLEVTVTATLVAAAPLRLTNVVCEQAIQVETGTSITTRRNTSIVFIDRSGSSSAVTIKFPDYPVDGQLLTILTQNTTSFTLTQNPGEGDTFGTGKMTTLDANATMGGTTGGASVTYIYIAAKKAWYRFFRG